MPKPAAKPLGAWLALAGRTAASKDYVFVLGDNASARFKRFQRAML